MTLLELTVVILVLLTLVTVLFIGARAWKRGSDRAGCVMNIRNVQQALRSHQNLTALSDGATIDVESDLIGPGNYLPSAPVCPGEGTYTYATTVPALGELAAKCSFADSRDHEPERYNSW